LPNTSRSEDSTPFEGSTRSFEVWLTGFPGLHEATEKCWHAFSAWFARWGDAPTQIILLGNRDRGRQLTFKKADERLRKVGFDDIALCQFLIDERSQDRVRGANIGAQRVG
jgi:hypothetical protein